MQGARLHPLIGESVLNRSRRLDRVTKYDNTGIVFPRILSILLTKQLERLDLVKIGYLNELVLQIAEVHVSTLLHDDFEGRILRREEPLRHSLHLFADGGRAHYQLLFYLLTLSVGEMLFNQFAELVLFAGVHERVELVDDQRAQVADE